jgi:hypothetical protein
MEVWTKEAVKRIGSHGLFEGSPPRRKKAILAHEKFNAARRDKSEKFAILV